ncbi:MULTISPECIES: hypothetical protein [unclassified Rhizobium]|jgi:hypothetical protein|uniref:hypothetical protein n=1 Tax=unclassified Rhizobium TaxID=2613769 RepID=UPI000DD728B9|nr:hypothetical protein [Rhizobium sp. UBA1881]
MRSDPRFAELIEEFPELTGENIVLTKELYAHFGLLFFTFALVEHSLINFAVFDAVGKGVQNKSIRSRAEWEQTFDQAYENAKSKSLGNLIKSVKSIPELEPEAAEISKMKSNRDYFAHHFFRDEAAYFQDDERGWYLLLRLQDVRRNAEALEDRLKPKFDEMHHRYGFTKPSEEQLDAALLEYENDALKATSSGTVKFGWES